MWLGELIQEMVVDWTNSILDFVFGLVNSVFEDSTTIINLTEVNSAALVLNAVASSIIVLLMMKQILSIYILQIDGDAEQDPLHILEKGCISLAAIQMQGFILTNLLNLASAIATEVLNVINISYTQPNNEAVMNSIEKSVGGGGVISVFLLVAYLIGFCMFFWKALRRGGELAVMKFLFPIFACDIVTVSMERFRAFASSYLVVIFGYVLQMILFKISLVQLMSPSGDILFALIFIIMAASAPKWIEKYVYTTGASKSVVGTARSAAYMIPQILRMTK